MKQAVPLNKQQQGMFLRRLFERHSMDVIYRTPLYNYLEKCGFRKEPCPFRADAYRFFPETTKKKV